MVVPHHGHLADADADAAAILSLRRFATAAFVPPYFAEWRRNYRAPLIIITGNNSADWQK